MTLAGERIVILGGTSGIGLAVAQAVAAEGARPLLASSDRGKVEQALPTLPAGAEGRVVDLLDAAQVEAFFREVGPFDHLVYTAGESLRLVTLEDLEIAAARKFFELRYWGALTAAKFARPGLRTGGSITFTSGTAGARPGAGWAVAASICSAMEGLTRALAVELAPIRVNIVAPGVVRTPLWRDMDEAARGSLYDGESRRLPVGRVAEARDVAEGFVYLMRQGQATGQTLMIDGGGLLV